MTTHSLQFQDLQKGQTFARFPLTITAEEVEAVKTPPPRFAAFSLMVQFRKIGVLA